ncbi:hypothetical protein SAMN05660209_02719 [Geodermatophilus africanus]|uniref:Uncharacterized protein n=1 Tax=Geodermatophilus africanus TaxID=1137993 RepID=A0A1H3JB42_9ACTN|nr:DUF6653 family protein [Geodermatophilus africanus]SDY36775.1 hypothetical protein SAMN05660209_02719 [Geodermatophilus africanus]
MTSPSPDAVTSDARLARLFGLRDDAWLRHANPVSVWVRFAVLPLILLSVWSRRWIGRRSLLALGASLVFTVVEPLLFPPPQSTRNWASRAVFGERIWTDRNAVDLPEQFRSTAVPNTTYAFQFAGLAAMARGLAVFDLRSVLGGLLLVQCAKAWFLDRMVLLFRTMAERDPQYASWEY